MFGPKVRLSDELYRKLAKIAEARGYSSAEEFIVHVLEKAAGEGDEEASEEEVKKRLKGLGYVG